MGIPLPGEREFEIIIMVCTLRSKRCMGRTENSTERLQASRGHRHWAKEIRSNQTLFGVGGEVRSKNNLTEPALLEMSGNATDQDLDSRIGQTLASAAFRPRLNAEISATPIELWRAPQPSYFAPYAASLSFGVDIIPPPCHYVSR